MEFKQIEEAIVNHHDNASASKAKLNIKLNK